MVSRSYARRAEMARATTRLESRAAERVMAHDTAASPKRMRVVGGRPWRAHGRPQPPRSGDGHWLSAGTGGPFSSRASIRAIPVGAPTGMVLPVRRLVVALSQFWK